MKKIAACILAAPVAIGAFTPLARSTVDVPSITGSSQRKRLYPRPTSRLFQQPDGDEARPGTARFTGISGSGTGVTGALDSVLSLIASDIASIVLGAVGLTIVVGHRLLTLDDTVESLALQTRADLLAVFACGSVLLNGITKLDVTAALAETVDLQGVTVEGVEWAGETDGSSEKELIDWSFISLLSATPARTCVILRKNDDDGSWKTVARAGVVPPELLTSSSTTPILDRVAAPTNAMETYLPTLQALPGRFELLSFMPANSQLALLVPIARREGPNDILLIGSDTAKSFAPRNVAWARVIAERISKIE